RGMGAGRGAAARRARRAAARRPPHRGAGRARGVAAARGGRGLPHRRARPRRRLEPPPGLDPRPRAAASPRSPRAPRRDPARLGRDAARRGGAAGGGGIGAVRAARDAARLPQRVGRRGRRLRRLPAALRRPRPHLDRLSARAAPRSRVAAARIRRRGGGEVAERERIEARDGLALTVGDDGAGRIAWGKDAPDALGPIALRAHAGGAARASRIAAVERSAGADDLGAFDALALRWEPAPPHAVRTSVRAYRERPLLRSEEHTSEL